MIRYSSNTSATRVLEWVGRDELLALLQSPGLRLYDPRHNGGLWVGKDYASTNAFRAIRFTTSRTGRRPCRWRACSTCSRPASCSIRPTPAR